MFDYLLLTLRKKILYLIFLYIIDNHWFESSTMIAVQLGYCLPLKLDLAIELCACVCVYVCMYMYMCVCVCVCVCVGARACIFYCFAC